MEEQKLVKYLQDKYTDIQNALILAVENHEEIEYIHNLEFKRDFLFFIMIDNDIAIPNA